MAGPRVVGSIPGRLEEIRYIRRGKYPGPYKHAFRTPARIHTMSDGSLWIRRDDGTWLDNNPRRGRRRTTMAKRRRHHRRNPMLAAYNPRRRHHHGRRRRHYRHNPANILHGVVKNPVGLATEAGLALGGTFGTITVGNLVYNMLPVSITTIGGGSPMTMALLRGAVRAGVAYGGEKFVSPMLREQNRKAWRLGLLIGTVGSTLLGLIGASFTIGAGDQAQLPGTILTQIGVAGYMPTPFGARRMRGYIPQPFGAYAAANRSLPAVGNMTAPNNSFRSRVGGVAGRGRSF